MDLDRRMDVLDYLRGFALMGIVLVNIVTLLSAKPPVPGTVDAAYWRFLYLFIEGRFYPIFTFLFGVGFYLFITRANQKGKNGYILFLRRIIVLFIIGIIHVRFQPGEALSVYAVGALLIFPFYKAPKWVNLGFGIFMLIVLSLFSMKLFMVVPLMLLGVAAGQFFVFHKMENHIKAVTVFTAVMLILGIIGLIFQFRYVPTDFGKVYAPGPDSTTDKFLKIGITIGPLVSAFYIGVLVLLLQVPLLQKIFSPLKSYGRMALTNYVMQTAFILIAGHALHLFEQISFWQTFYLSAAIYVVQIAFSKVWLCYFRYGPLEWLWRLITYMEIPPMRK